MSEELSEEEMKEFKEWLKQKKIEEERLKKDREAFAEARKHWRNLHQKNLEKSKRQVVDFNNPPRPQILPPVVRGSVKAKRIVHYEIDEGVTVSGGTLVYGGKLIIKDEFNDGNWRVYTLKGTELKNTYVKVGPNGKLRIHYMHPERIDSFRNKPVSIEDVFELKIN